MALCEQYTLPEFMVNLLPKGMWFLDSIQCICMTHFHASGMSVMQFCQMLTAIVLDLRREDEPPGIEYMPRKYDEYLDQTGFERSSARRKAFYKSIYMLIF